MKTIISNKIYVINATPSLKLWCDLNLVVTNPMWETLTRLGKQDQIYRKHIPQKMYLYAQRGETLILPFGVINSIWNAIKDSEIELRFNNAGFISHREDTIAQPLYDYQEEAVKRMVSAKGGVLVGGCGSGKTNCGIEILHRIGKKFLFLVHTKDLLKQALKRFNFLYPNLDVGTITEGKINMGKDGTIATVQTMANIDPELYKHEFDVVMTDECHHISGSPTLLKYFLKVIEQIPARYKYGLTATPSRGDTLIKSMYTTVGTNVRGDFEPVYQIDKSQIKTLTAKHIKVELDTPFTYSMLNEDGSFNYPNLIDYLSTETGRNDAIMNKVMELDAEGRKQLILCHRVEQAKYIYEQLKDKTQIKLLVGSVSSKKREEVLSEQVPWKVIVATYSLAKEGLDVPSLDTLHMVTPQKDKAMVVQCVGRIERIKDGKHEPEVYDYVDMKIPYCTGAFKKRKVYIEKRY